MHAVGGPAAAAAAGVSAKLRPPPPSPLAKIIDAGMWMDSRTLLAFLEYLGVRHHHHRNHHHHITVARITLGCLIDRYFTSTAR